MTLLADLNDQRRLLVALESWYKSHGRHDMAWRKTKDPYAILISEFMLQQTTVATVKPYYDRFLKKFPTVKALAKSPLGNVLALWSGLGYYARARNLWVAAKMIVKEFGGRVPENQIDLQKLPGVGLYTSGAISSLAYNRPAIVLDGNINRVLMRLLAIEDDSRLKAVQVVLRKLVLELTQAASAEAGPRHTVLGLMDLGSDVCTPQSPLCPSCPVSKFCLAFEYGKQDLIPAKGDEVERPRVRRLHALIPFKGKWLVGRRPTNGLFGGLWEFPGVDAKPGIEPAVILEKRLRAEPGFRLQVMRALSPFEHILSHREFTVRGFIFEPAVQPPNFKKKKTIFYQEYRWVTLKALEKLGISAITRKLASQLGSA